MASPLRRAPAGDRPALLGGVPLARPPIRLTEPTLPPLATLLPDLEAIWARRQLTNHGPLVTAFAAQMAARLGTHFVPCVTGTAALETTLRTLGVRGEVVVPAITFSATAHAVVAAGARPVFADVDPWSWCLAPKTVAPCVGPGTEALLAVHLFGTPCDVDALTQFAARHQLALVFDAAQAFGSRYPGDRPVATGGRAEVFSFHATKLLPAGEGGGVATADGDLAAALSLAMRFGDTGDGVARRPGTNGKLNEIAAAIALHGLPEVDARIAHRARGAERYWTRLGALPGLDGPRLAPGARTNHQFLPVLVDGDAFGLSAAQLHTALAAEGVDARRHYHPPLHRQPAFAQATALDLPVADDLAARTLCLPMYSHLTDAEIDLVAGAIERCHRWRAPLAAACG